MNTKTKNTIEAKIDEAINYVKKYEPVHGYWTAFSGGKDSQIVEKICNLADVKYVAGYTRTGIDPPEVVKFIKQNYPDTVFLKPKISFYKLIAEKKMPPLITKRWCCDVIKEKPGIETKKQFPVHITGVRAEESYKRARQPRLDIQHSIKAVTIKPIFHWTEYHVWSFIEYFNMPYCKLYDEGFDRLGCVPCPMMFHKNQARLNMHRKRWPKIFAAFERACQQWYERKGMKDCPHGNFEKYMEAYYRGFE